MNRKRFIFCLLIVCLLAVGVVGGVTVYQMIFGLVTVLAWLAVIVQGGA